jgi:hypothetical protein
VLKIISFAYLMTKRFAKMRRIRDFIVRKTNFAILLSILVFIVSSAGIIYSPENVSLMISFASSGGFFLMVFVWKNGKLPFISSDRIWSFLWYKETDEREESHKKHSLNLAGLAFLIMIPSFLFGMIWLILSEIL